MAWTYLQLDDFSTEEESIKTLNNNSNSTSRAYGEATGARPRSGTKQGKKGHYTKEEEDRTFKEELRRRSELAAEEKRCREKIREESEENLRQLKEWEQKHWKEVGAMIEAKAKVYSTMAHENERRRARSARRAKGQTNLETEKNSKLSS